MSELLTARQHVPAGSKKVWLPGIEALRGVAAMTVVVAHLAAISPNPDFPGGQLVIGLAAWGVNLFFMLSGYLLVDTFWQERRADLRMYAIRRFFRIAPAYYVNLALLFLFFAPSTLLFSEQGRTQVVASVTFTHFLFPSTSSSLDVNGSLWTLTVEMMLYALLPVMALAVRAAPWSAIIGLVVIGVGWRGLVAVDGGGLRDLYFGDSTLDPVIQSFYIARQFIGILPVFALGIGARWMVLNGHLDWFYRRLPTRLGISSFLVMLVPSVGLLHWVFAAADFRNRLLFSTYDFLLMLLVVPALLVAARPASFSPSMFQAVASWVGERSYSIYLWHYPIILAVYERGPSGLSPAAGGYAWRVPLALVVTLVFAAVSFQAVERPGMDLGRRLSKRVMSSKTPKEVTHP